MSHFGYVLRAQYHIWRSDIPLVACSENFLKQWPKGTLIMERFENIMLFATLKKIINLLACFFKYAIYLHQI